jgi:hypothetical protein
MLLCAHAPKKLCQFFGGGGGEKGPAADATDAPQP